MNNVHKDCYIPVRHLTSAVNKIFQYTQERNILDVVTVSVQRVCTVAGKSEAVATATKNGGKQVFKDVTAATKMAGNGHGLNLLAVYSIPLAQDTEDSLQ